jgi:hypothetical protein
MSTVLMPGKEIRLPEVGGRIGRELLKGRWYEQEMLEYIRSSTSAPSGWRGTTSTLAPTSATTRSSSR